jgi:hypothetical protein
MNLPQFRQIWELTVQEEIRFQGETLQLYTRAVAIIVSQVQLR